MNVVTPLAVTAGALMVGASILWAYQYQGATSFFFWGVRISMHHWHLLGYRGAGIWVSLGILPAVALGLAARRSRWIRLTLLPWPLLGLIAWWYGVSLPDAYCPHPNIPACSGPAAEIPWPLFALGMQLTTLSALAAGSAIWLVIKRKPLLAVVAVAAGVGVAFGAGALISSGLDRFAELPAP